jgi:hypothetical protein
VYGGADVVTRLPNFIAFSGIKFVIINTIMKHSIRLLVAALTISAPAYAGVIYTFVGTGQAPGQPAEALAFQLAVPEFVSASGFSLFSCAQLSSNTNCASTGTNGAPISAVFFIGNNLSSPNSSFTDELGFRATDNIAYGFFFPTGAFTNPGIYNSVVGTASLTVTAVPEPSSVALFFNAGLLLSCLLARSGMLKFNSGNSTGASTVPSAPR